MISYDIAEQNSSEYDPLWSLLVQLKAQRVLYSQWVVIATSGSATKLADTIAEAVPLKKQDRLLVQEVTQDASWINLELPDSQAVIVLAAARR